MTPKLKKPVSHCHGPGVADVTKEKPLPMKEVDCPANWWTVSSGARLTYWLSELPFCHLKTEDPCSTYVIELL